MPKPMALLKARVPLTLLIDLLDENGPRSSRIYSEEQADLSWLRSPQDQGVPGLGAQGDCSVQSRQ